MSKQAAQFSATTASSPRSTSDPTSVDKVSKPSELQKRGELVSFEDQANPFESFFCSYLDPLFSYGAKNDLVHEDLGCTSKQDSSVFLYNKFVKFWEEEMKKDKKTQSLWNVLWKTVGYHRLFTALVLYACYAGVSYGPILILNALVKHLEGTDKLDTAQVGIYVALMFVLPMMGSLFVVHSNNILAHVGLQFRNVLIDMIYRKALKLSPSSRQQHSTGMVVNMFSNDTAQLQRFLFFLNNCSVAPFQIAVSLALIYQQVGPATFVGLGFMIILIPLNGVIFGTLNEVRKKKVKVTDMRVKLMNEILGGIRVIKYYAWEGAFNQKIVQIRDRELVLLKQLAYIIAIGFTLIMFSAPIVQPILIFFTYVKLGYQLDAARAFTTIALFNLMQLPFAFLPMGLAQFSQSLVSTKRMLDFFSSEELVPYVKTEEGADGTVISFENVSMGWVTEDSLAATAEEKDKAAAAAAIKTVATYKKLSSDVVDGGDAVAEVNDVGLVDSSINRSVHTLKGLNINIKRGQLVAIVGSVGCGKSSLLSGMLGELNLLSGDVRVAGSIAYCEQRPWIMNQTVKDNILFNRPYDEAKFKAALHASNLEDDIKVLPGGVLTEIGERGINLSGGQKARVALARAVYRDADIYLLDDPLSAVDAHVGQHIFNECIKKTLAEKTRILVTHHVHLLHECDLVIIIEDGMVKAMGSYDELTRSDINIEAYVQRSAEAAETVMTATVTSVVEPTDDEPTEREGQGDDVPVQAVELKEEKEKKSNEVEEGLEKETDKEKDKGEKPTGSKIITIEERNMGDVSLKTYMYYISAGGWGWFNAMMLCQIGSQVIAILASFYLSYWGLVTVRRLNSGNPLTSEENLTYLNMFALISMISVATVTSRSLLLAHHRLGTSSKLHTELLNTTLGAPVAFFDVTPLGRILNRLSSDMLVIDEELSQTISQVLNSFFQCLGAIGAIAGATKGTFLVLMVPLIFLYERFNRYFRLTNTAVGRLEAVSRSPIYQDFSQALSGVNSIRAYAEEQRFVNHLEEQVDRNSIAAITVQLAGQWLAIRLDFLGSLTTFFIALIAVVTNGFIPAGFLALGLTYSFQLTQFLKFAVRMAASIEVQMNSVERIKYYIDNIEQEVTENPIDISPTSTELPKDWPAQGVIVGRNIQMRYRDGPLVLKGFDFDIKAREKVGIAGRTGSGKSSMMIALYRVQALAEGSIFIDGVDASRVPLQLLRSKLGIIPQDPVMFSATVRFNLDPFDKHSDSELWEALEMAEMKDHVSTLPGKLLEEVSEGGDNFSAGQRQLICIARAILRKPKILVLDEATASIDNETDSHIQSMIKASFKNCTVLTIAHRLHTIFDSDRIMVLDNGQLAEMGSSEDLLKSEEGLFSRLWERHKKSHGAHITPNSSSIELSASI